MYLNKFLFIKLLINIVVYAALTPAIAIGIVFFLIAKGFFIGVGIGSSLFTWLHSTADITATEGEECSRN